MEDIKRNMMIKSFQGTMTNGGLVVWALWHINLLWVIACQILFMYIYQIYMNCKHIICSLTFLDKPELTYLHTVILGAILANTSTST